MKNFILALTLFLISLEAFAYRKSMIVGGDSSTPGAAFEVTSTSRFSLPCSRMTTSQRDLMSATSTAACIYNLDTDRYQIYTNGIWYNTLIGLDNSSSTGHDHDGINSKQVDASNISTATTTADKLLASDGAGGTKYIDSPAAISTASSSVCVVVNEQPDGTNGGSCTGQSWNNRYAINKIASGQCDFVDTSNNNMLLVQNPYFIDCDCPCYACDAVQLGFVNGSGTVSISSASGSGIFNPNAVEVIVSHRAHVEVTSATGTVELFAWMQSGQGLGNCKGYPETAGNGAPEVFCSCTITRH